MMILNHRQRIFEAAAKSDPRTGLEGVLFMPDGTATASDGHSLTRVKFQLENDELPEGGLLLSARDMRAGWGRGNGDRTILHDGTNWLLLVGAQSTVLTVLEHPYPKVDAVIPASSSARMLTLNVAYLVAMAKAAGAESVTLEVPEFQDVKLIDGQQITSAIRCRLRREGEDEELGTIQPIVIE